MLTNSDSNAMIAIYETHPEAEAAVAELQRAGFDMHGFPNGGRSAYDTKLFQQAPHVSFDRAFGNQELDSNFLVALAGRHTLKDCELART